MLFIVFVTLKKLDKFWDDLFLSNLISLPTSTFIVTSSNIFSVFQFQLNTVQLLKLIHSNFLFVTIWFTLSLPLMGRMYSHPMLSWDRHTSSINPVSSLCVRVFPHLLLCFSPSHAVEFNCLLIFISTEVLLSREGYEVPILTFQTSFFKHYLLKLAFFNLREFLSYQTDFVESSTMHDFRKSPTVETKYVKKINLNEMSNRSVSHKVRSSS